MIGYAFRIAARTMVRNKLYTAINMLGLALGICACIVIYLIASFELSFDRFHPESDRIYCLNSFEQLNKSDPPSQLPSVTPALAGAVRSGIPGIRVAAPYHILNDVATEIPGGNSVLNFTSSPVFTTGDYFEIMQYDWIAGERSVALNAPFKVVLTEARAKLYFGNLPIEQVINKVIVYNDSLVTRVSGIVKNWKKNTDFPYQEFVSLSSADNGMIRQELQLDERKGIPYSSRVMLKLEKNAGQSAVKNAIDKLYDEKFKTDNYPAIAMEPLRAVHFIPQAGGARINTAHLPTLYTLMGIAAFILLLAVINYINLATAQSMSREKNTGIRKILGSSRKKLIVQFLVESFILAFIATGLAAAGVVPVLGLARGFISPEIHFFILDPVTVLFLLGITLLVTVTAGLYPAWFISSAKPVINLGGMAAGGNSKWLLRRGLIVFQFAISLIFIMLSLGIGKQIHYMLGNDLGFQSQAIVLLTTDEDDLYRIKVAEESFKKVAGVEMVARQNIPPMGNDRGFFTIQYGGTGKEILVAAIKADENYIPLYDMKLLAGRNLFPSDTIREFVINETLSRQLGFKTPMDALGKQIWTWGKFSPIVGVVADFHQASFHETIQPQVITSVRCSNIVLRLNTRGKSPAMARGIMDRVEREWKKLYPNASFQYSFFDDTIKALYEKEKLSSVLMNVSTIITVFISCIGLFGLTLFIVRKRMKEISIRKVLGASVQHIVILLSRDFTALVGLALVIASPIAGYFLHKWLQDYVYRIPVNPLLFLVAGSLVLFVALLTTCVITIKAAMTNPVKNLRVD